MFFVVNNDFWPLQAFLKMTTGNGLLFYALVSFEILGYFASITCLLFTLVERKNSQNTLCVSGFLLNSPKLALHNASCIFKTTKN